MFENVNLNKHKFTTLAYAHECVLKGIVHPKMMGELTVSLYLFLSAMPTLKSN